MHSPLMWLEDAVVGVIQGEAPRSADGSETGGILLGHDYELTIRVTAAGVPGLGAQRTPHNFLRDLAHAQRLADEAYERDRSVWLGEWHTHPMGPATPSTTDVDTYGRLLADPHLDFERIVSIIVTPCPLHGWSELRLAPWIVDPDGARMVELAVDPTDGGEEAP